MAASVERTARPLTIGAVCRRLKDEFPDISISKIRYLEDQGLISPQRTESGYRLFAEQDLERLRTVLRMQRDEFLPLRVIRDELDSPAVSRRRERRGSSTPENLRESTEPRLTLEQLCERAGVTPAFARELEDYGLIARMADSAGDGYLEPDADIAALCARLLRYNLEPRNLRAFRNGAAREASLIEQAVTAGMRSRNPERRQAALDELSTLAGLSTELSRLLFYRALRPTVSGT